MLISGDLKYSSSIDISGKKEYNYEYKEGRIVSATEADIELFNEIVTSTVMQSGRIFSLDLISRPLNTMLRATPPLISVTR